MLQPIDELFTANCLIDTMLELTFSERAVFYDTKFSQFSWGHYKVFSVCDILAKQKFGRRKVKDWMSSETFNGRLKFFRALSDTFHHNPDKHVHVFEAVCVTVQYQMDNGGKLFDV